MTYEFTVTTDDDPDHIEQAGGEPAGRVNYTARIDHSRELNDAATATIEDALEHALRAAEDETDELTLAAAKDALEPFAIHCDPIAQIRLIPDDPREEDVHLGAGAFPSSNVSIIPGLEK